jgi:hypothetical protein
MIMERQRAALEVFLAQPRNAPKPFNPRSCVFWDDYNGKDITFNDALKDYYYTGRHYQTFNIFNAQYPKLTPPAIRSNTDYAVLFNTDYIDNLKEYWEDFAGKMHYQGFVQLMRKHTEEVEHGFLVIDNDPNVPYSKKFYYGVAEELPFDLDHIIGCQELWAENNKQLFEIANGTMADKIDRINQISKPDGIKIPSPDDDVDDRQRPVWNTRAFAPVVGSMAARRMAPLV